MNKRVYGIAGIRSVMASWNADFSGRPKTISDGTIFGSDKAFKYPIKRFFMEKGKKVLYIRTLKIIQGETEDDISLGTKSLKEKYEEIFDVPDLSKKTNQTDVIKNLFEATDVKNFGATFAESGKNVSITGAVQVGQGFNIYEDATVETQQIQSPFRNAAKEEKKDKDGNTPEENRQASLGTKTVTAEAHYLYPFTVNPANYKTYVDIGLTEGYTEDDYELLKKGICTAATGYNTNSKMGCSNEIAMFIETDEELYLPDIAQFVTFRKESGKNIFSLGFTDMINRFGDRIKNIEIYINPLDVVVEHQLKNYTMYDIFTGGEI